MSTGTSLNAPPARESSPIQPGRSNLLHTSDWSKPGGRMRRIVMPLLVVATVAALAAWAARYWAAAGSNRPEEVSAEVTRGTLPVVVSAGGELDSSNTVTVVSDVEGQQIKIVEMLREGTHVTAGQVVMRFDSGEIERAAAAQEIKLKQAEGLAKAATEELRIQKNKGESEVAKAKLALKLAALDKKKYLEGDYGVEVKNLQGSIALAEADLNEARDTQEYYRKLVKKGFRTPEQLRTKEQAVARAEYYLSRDQEKLRVLEEFMRERQEAELTAKAEDADRELERAESSRTALVTKAETDRESAEVTARLERSVLDKLQKQLEHCSVRAPQDGVVVYQKDKNARIELGATVHFKQKLFSLPDLTRMQVKAYIHEAFVQKVRPGLNAEIRVDAYGGAVLRGTVRDVASFYDSTRQWLSGGNKEYATWIQIDDLPDAGLKPGMTAEVKILVDERPDVLTVPLQAVTEQGGEYYCYVLGPGGPQRRRVTIGENNEYRVEIRTGLTETDRVALDARSRAAAESKVNDNGSSPATAADSPKPAQVAVTD